MTRRILVALCLVLSGISTIPAQVPWSDPIFISTGGNPDLDMDK